MITFHRRSAISFYAEALAYTLLGIFTNSQYIFKMITIKIYRGAKQSSGETIAPLAPRCSTSVAPTSIQFYLYTYIKESNFSMQSRTY